MLPFLFFLYKFPVTVAAGSCGTWFEWQSVRRKIEKIVLGMHSATCNTTSKSALSNFVPTHQEIERWQIAASITFVIP